MSLFARAAAQLPLTPAERAIRAFVVLFLSVTGPISSIPLVTDVEHALSVYAATGTLPAIAWGADLQWFLLALAAAAALGLRKYFTAHADGPLLTVTQTTGLQTAALDSAPVSFVPPPPASNAPAAPSYVPLPAGSAGALTVSTSTVTAHAPTRIVPPDAPQVPAVDTPVQTMPAITDGTPASAQAVTDTT